MKLITKAAIAIAGVTLACQGAFAQNGDLLIGFNGFNVGSTASDYIADLGAGTTITADAANTQLNPSGSVLTSFTPTFSSSLNVGVVGGLQNSAIYETVLRGGGGSYLTQGTETIPTRNSTSTGNAAAGALGNVTLGTVASATSAGGGQASWTESVSQGPGQVGSANSSFGAEAGNAAGNANAFMANFGSSSTIVEDLFKATDSGSPAHFNWAYIGTITIDLSGATPSVIWDAVAAAPEPTMYGVFAGAGLLLLALRRQLVRNIA